MILEILFPTSKFNRKPMSERPVVVAILSFACTCSVLGGTIAMFHDAATPAVPAVPREM